MSTKPTLNLTRRGLLRGCGATLLGASLLKISESPASAQTEDGEGSAEKDIAADTGPLTPLNRFPRSVQEYYVRRAREVERQANARRAALRTKADAEGYVADVRARLAQCFGPFPARTPLNARVTAVHQREGFKIENVIFESRPGFLVTANLYVPTGRAFPLPAVLGPCGHSDTGKAGATYQMFGQGLAKQGYVTLVFDPLGQGERLQHVDRQLKPRFGVGTKEHTYVGTHMTLVGENLPTWFAWDGIRALDYLLSRPEVDLRHVGATGNSGGGGQTARLCALEPRLTMAAPSCSVTTLRRNLENEYAVDPENCPWRLLALGLDHSDFIAAMAPRPVKLLGQEKDFFDARGFEEACARLRHLYRLLGSEENFDSFLGANYHGFDRPQREAMYGWFNRQTGLAQGQQEPKITLEKPEILRCTPNGQVAELGSATELSIGRELARALQAARGAPKGEALRQAIIATLRLPPREDLADYRILQPNGPRQYPQRTAASYLVETESDIAVMVYRLSETPLFSRIPRGPTRALLYVSHRSADAELREDPWVKAMCAAEPGAAIFACDVRGVGESHPAISTAEVPGKGGADYFHSAAGWMLDYPTPGQRTHDLLRVLDLLRGTGHTEVHLVAQGWGTIPGTFAAVLHEGVAQVTLKHALQSYGAIADSVRYRWPASAFPPGILKSFDLPDCYRALESKSLRQIDPASPDDGFVAPPLRTARHSAVRPQT